jgi:YfiH family protein
MPLREIHSLQIYQFDAFENHALRHGVVSRRGGVSPPPWDSLNVGSNVGDDPLRVSENVQRVMRAFDRDISAKYDAWQTHSDAYIIVEEPRADAPPRRADILLTDKAGITLFMRFADCVPIFLYDPATPAIALVHAGWQGLIRKAPLTAVRKLTEVFQTRPENVIAGIGPSICQECYQVGEDVLEQLARNFGAEGEEHVHYNKGNAYLDLWSLTREQLEISGIQKIEESGICTAMNLDDWYSHRAEGGRTGRFAALFELAE